MTEKDLITETNLTSFDLYHPNTKIVNPPTLLSRLTNLKQLDDYKIKRPQTLVIDLDENLNVLNSSGEKIDELVSFLEKLNHRFLVAVETENEVIANAFVHQMNAIKWFEFFLISANQQLLLNCKKAVKHTNIILKINDINAVDFDALVFNKVLLPIDAIKKEYIDKLQQKTYFIYTEANTLIEREKALLSGINGIITNASVKMINRYETFNETTHIRDVHFIAHRGLHNGYKNSISPENTLKTAKHVLEAGVRIIEIDIHLTKDNEVVVIHDFKTNRLARRRKVIAKTTLEKLTKIPLKKTSIQQTPSYISSLKDFLMPFKDKEVLFFIETKPLSSKLIEKTKEVLEQLNMTNRVVFISFYYPNTLSQQALMPSVKNGFLYSKNIPTHDDTLAKMLWFLIPLQTTYNPNYTYVTETLVKELNIRGIGVWPYTADGVDEIFKLYNTGVFGITTNTFDEVKHALIHINTKDEYTYTINQEPLKIPIDNYALSGVLKTIQSDLILVDDNQTGITFEDNQIIGAKSKGSAYFYYHVKLNLPNGAIIYKTTKLFKINVQ